MKALSLIQPWASFLFPFSGRPAMKLHETRSWATRYRGTIAIHASKSKDWEALESYQEIMTALCRIVRRDGKDMTEFLERSPKFEDLPRSCIIGLVELEDCMETKKMRPATEEDSVLGDFFPGRYAWRMAKPVLFANPIPCRGSLGLWEVPEDIMGKILIELDPRT